MSDRTEFKKQVSEIQDKMNDANKKLDKAVIKAREDGLTWQEIAQEVGLTRQGAWARWAEKDAANPS